MNPASERGFFFAAIKAQRKREALPALMLGDLIMNKHLSPSRWTLDAIDLSQFTGTENWYSLKPLSAKITYTDGVSHVAEHGGAVWLITDIVAAQHDPKVAAEPFQVWKLTVVNPDRFAQLVCEDGNGNIVYTQTYSWTDFPMDEITFWLTDNVILLPSEY
jgi:hypothetical protein